LISEVTTLFLHTDFRIRSTFFHLRGTFVNFSGRVAAREPLPSATPGGCNPFLSTLFGLSDEVLSRESVPSALLERSFFQRPSRRSLQVRFPLTRNLPSIFGLHGPSPPAGFFPWTVDPSQMKVLSPCSFPLLFTVCCVLEVSTWTAAIILIASLSSAFTRF